MINRPAPQHRITLPIEPMVPIASETVPEGDDWGYQLKWDGVRMIADIQPDHVTLYSRQGRVKNEVFPELVKYLGSIAHSCIVDGEVIVFDPDSQRPIFHKVLQRERSRPNHEHIKRKYPISYVLFDLLAYEDENLLSTPYSERYQRLKQLFPLRDPELFVTDLHEDWEALWDWVIQHKWEGIVSKKLSAPYRSGKQHHAAYKKKIQQQFRVSIVGLVYHLDRLSSLIMNYNGHFFGKVSLGLSMNLRQMFADYAKHFQTNRSYWNPLPKDLSHDHIIWLKEGITAIVRGLEVTASGKLRHPKIMELIWTKEGETD